MSNISQWDPTAANNDAAPPDGAPPATMTIPQIDDTIREMMAAAARVYQDKNGTLVSTGSGGTYAVTTNNAHAVFADVSPIVFRANHVSPGASTLNVDGTGARSMVIKGGQDLEENSILLDQLVAAFPNVDQDRYEVALVAAGISASDLASSTLGFVLINGTIAASVDSNVLTVAVKTLAGDDPSAADPVYALFRSSTLANGTFVVRTISAALSLDVPDGADLGTSNSTPFRYWITLHDDNGTVRLGISNRRTSTGISPINEAGKSTTTAISASADSASTYYTGTAISTAAPLQVVGYVEYTSGLATAGTYNNAPDLVHLRTWGTSLPGQIIQEHATPKTDAASATSVSSFATITGMSVQMTVISPANLVRVSFAVSVGAGGTQRPMIRLRRTDSNGTASVAVGDAAGSRERATVTGGPPHSNISQSIGFIGDDYPGVEGTLTYFLEWKEGGGGDLKLNHSATDTDNANFARTASTISIKEIMG